jgi:tetratricopeptide (TPR) repeat protein
MGASSEGGPHFPEERNFPPVATDDDALVSTVSDAGLGLELDPVGESLDVSEGGEFVLWAGLKLPLSWASQQVQSQSQRSHALLKLARGAAWDPHSYSTQAVVAALNSVSASKIRHGDLADAKLLLSRAIELIESSRGDTARGTAPDVQDAGMQRLLAVTLNNTACLYRREGRLAEAMCCLEDALAIDSALAIRARVERCSGATSGGRIGANASALLLNLSTVLAVLGRWVEARVRAQQAVACVWSFDTHWQSPHERMYTAVAGYHNLALSQRGMYGVRIFICNAIHKF